VKAMTKSLGARLLSELNAAHGRPDTLVRRAPQHGNPDNGIERHCTQR